MRIKEIIQEFCCECLHEVQKHIRKRYGAEYQDTRGDPKASLKCTWDAIFCDLGADYLRHVPSVRKHQLFLINVNFCYTNKMLFQKVQYFILGGLVALFAL